MAAYLGLIDLSMKRLRVLTADPGERRDEPRSDAQGHHQPHLRHPPGREVLDRGDAAVWRDQRSGAAAGGGAAGGSGRGRNELKIRTRLRRLHRHTGEL